MCVENLWKTCVKDVRVVVRAIERIPLFFTLIFTRCVWRSEGKKGRVFSEFPQGEEKISTKKVYDDNFPLKVISSEISYSLFLTLIYQ